MAQAITRWIMGRPLRTHFSMTSTRRGYSSRECTDRSGMICEAEDFLDRPEVPLFRGRMVMSSLWLQKHSSDMKPISERRFSLLAASSKSLPK